MIIRRVHIWTRPTLKGGLKEAVALLPRIIGNVYGHHAGNLNTPPPPHLLQKMKKNNEKWNQHKISKDLHLLIMAQTPCHRHKRGIVVFSLVDLAW